MLDECAKQRERERALLTQVMNQCVRQAAAIAMRRNEQYLARAQARRKQRQEHAVRSIQLRVRHAIKRNQRKRESKLEHVAALVIQRHVRMSQERARARRYRKQQLHDHYGLAFRYARRINRTFVLLNVSVNEIDRDAGVFELAVRAWHPSGGVGAVLRISWRELNEIVMSKAGGTDASQSQQQQQQQQALTRRAIVDSVVREHLDVFRSAKRDLLVLSLIKTPSRVECRSG